MATRRRDVLPSKEKATSSPQTGTPRLKAATNKTTTTNASTAPKKPGRPTPKTATVNVVVKKPVSTANKPAKTKPKPSVAASPKPIQKARVASSAVPPRSSSLPSKTTSSSQTKSLPNARRRSIGLKKKEARTTTSARKQKQITTLTVDKVEDLPEPEIQLKDIQYSYSAEAKGNIDVLVTEIDQQPSNSAKIEDEIDRVDPAVVIAPVSEQKETPPDKAEKLEKEVKVEAKQEEEEAVVSKDDDECKVVKRPAVENKKEILFLPKQQEKTHGKFDSPVSNSVIEEAANKLLEQRRNKVRALAGAFETVISLQEK